VLIVVDTLRRDHVAAFGGATPTPRIDALAERGQAYSEVRAAFHQTTMSMGSLFTGRTPSLESGDPARSLRWNGRTWCGMARFAQPDETSGCLPAALPTLGERMQEAGYWTIGIPSNQFLFGDAGFSRGFDDWSEVGMAKPMARIPLAARRGLAAQRSAQVVLDAVDAALERRRDDRFFLYVHFMDVHDFQFRGLRYADTVAEIDRTVGALLDRLDRDGLLEGATVIFTSDHGERLGEPHTPRGLPGHNGNPSFEEMLEIPLIVAPPVEGQPGRVRRTQDVHDLLARIAGLPAASAGELEEDELYLSEVDFRTYVEGAWKSALRRQDDQVFLYDLAEDPNERRNAAEAHPDVVARHRERVQELSRALAVESPQLDRGITEEERRTLEALGYVE
jgi:arylsulfatase A-like enzyme